MNETTRHQSELAYRRLVLKLSGDALADPSGCGVDATRAAEIAGRVAAVHALGAEIVIVIGGGNLWRGHVGVDQGMNQAQADSMGMLATVINGLALQDALERCGIVTRVQTAVHMNTLAEPYIRLRAMRHLEKGRIVISAGGTGNPYFTTDTAAALRAAELGADVFIKATKVDGVFSADPEIHPEAERFSHLSYREVLAGKFLVMDMTAVTLCEENQMPILVLDFWRENALVDALLGVSQANGGTLIDGAVA
ncbi:MAG: UMP kinase [Chloroflexi bacterium]|nr:UMP kinase [Chloroflexota bacterium]